MQTVKSKTQVLQPMLNFSMGANSGVYRADLYRDPCALTMRKSPQKIMRQMQRIDKGVDFVCGVIHRK